MTKSPSQKDHYLINPETGRISITEVFGETLALLLAKEWGVVYYSRVVARFNFCVT